MTKHYHQVDQYDDTTHMYQELCEAAKKYIIDAVEHTIQTDGSFEFTVGAKSRYLSVETIAVYGLELFESMRPHGGICILPFEVYGPNTAPNYLGRRMSAIHVILKGGPTGFRYIADSIEAFKQSLLAVEVPYIFNTIEPTFPSASDFESLEYSNYEVNLATIWLRDCTSRIEALRVCESNMRSSTMDWTPRHREVDS